MKCVLVAEPARLERTLGLLAARLGPEEDLVRAVDTYRATGRVTLHVPCDPTAEVVAREPPRLQPGGITEIVTYLRVRDRTFREITISGRDVEKDTDVELQGIVRKKPARAWRSG